MQGEEENSCLPGFGSKSVQVKKAVERRLCTDTKKATTHQAKKAYYISIPLYVTRICVYVPQIVNTDSLEDEIAMDFFSGFIFFP